VFVHLVWALSPPCHHHHCKAMHDHPGTLSEELPLDRVAYCSLHGLQYLAMWGIHVTYDFLAEQHPEALASFKAWLGDDYRRHTIDEHENQVIAFNDVQRTPKCTQWHPTPPNGTHQQPPAPTATHHHPACSPDAWGGGDAEELGQQEGAAAATRQWAARTTVAPAYSAIPLDISLTDVFGCRWMLLGAVRCCWMPLDTVGCH